MVKYALKIFGKNLQLMLDISKSRTNQKKSFANNKMYVIII